MTTLAALSALIAELLEQLMAALTMRFFLSLSRRNFSLSKKGISLMVRRKSVWNK